MENPLRALLGRARVLTVFGGGVLAGLLLSNGRHPLLPAIDRQGGSEPREMQSARDLSPPPPSPVATIRAPAADLPVLSAREVARRALKITASVRGDGVYGSGIVVDTRGYVLTNYHVIQGVENLRVGFVDKDEMPATVVDQDKDLDLALLKVETTRPVAALPADFLEAEVGDDVLAVGCPRKMNFSVARGMISYVGRKIDGHYYLQSSLPTNDGNSGGPVVNDRGEVLGVMTFILRDSQGLAFAVPLDYAYERFSSILKSPHLDLARFQRWQTEMDSPSSSSAASR